VTKGAQPDGDDVKSVLPEAQKRPNRSGGSSGGHGTHDRGPVTSADGVEDTVRRRSVIALCNHWHRGVA
jgi:hypothetical protein